MTSLSISQQTSENFQAYSATKEATRDTLEQPHTNRPNDQGFLGRITRLPGACARLLCPCMHPRAAVDQSRLEIIEPAADVQARLSSSDQSLPPTPLAEPIESSFKQQANELYELDKSNFPHQAYTRKMHNLRHHLIAQQSATRTVSNPSGRLDSKYSDSKRISAVSAGALSALHGQGCQVTEQVTTLSQDYKHRSTNNGYVLHHYNSKNPAQSPGDLHVTDPQLHIEDLHGFLERVNSFKKTLADASQTKIIDLSVTFLRKQFIPGGNPALASDVQRLLLLLIDVSNADFTTDQVSLYTDHDTHSKNQDSTQFSTDYYRLLIPGQVGLPYICNNDSRLMTHEFETRWNQFAEKQSRHQTMLASHEETLSQARNDLTANHPAQPDIQNHFIFNNLESMISDSITRDINQLTLANVKTPVQQKLVQDFIFSKLDAINGAADNVDTLFKGADRLISAQEKPESSGHKKINSRFEQAALLTTGTPLLGERQADYQPPLNPDNLEGIEATWNQQINQAYYGGMSEREDFILSKNFWSQGDFEGNWRPADGTQIDTIKPISTDTTDIPSFLLSAYQV